ncbi:MAG: Efflux transporter periplasmic adaptor subunit [Cyanobacteriota bacterium erpe_2018_sw_21hr_WHONDRS-SW48-000092_B_bin.40]|jgi:cobalt-zinc-cadmium efflux system membrane fusion protein|nr:Efflux transporter periplasmic adaptor subunit [Cyanobacteriota bacterium erpe_2018_sw_21hr_WHONDRS-SW48-000092_B_bin.40]
MRSWTRPKLLKSALLLLCVWTAIPSFAEEETEKPNDAFATVHVSADVQRAIGIKVESVRALAPVTRKQVNGQIEAIPANTAAVNAPLAGRVLTLLAQKGQRVKKGDALMTLDSSEIRQLSVESQRLIALNKAAEEQAQAKVELAKRNYEREKTLLGLKIASTKDYQTAEADFKQAEAELNTTRSQTRLSGAQLANRLAQLGQAIKATAQGHITLYAPISGIVLEQLVTPGEAVEAAKPLFKLININKVWATGQIYEKDLQFVRLGQRIEILTSAYPERIFSGSIVNIDPVVDPISRTLAVRAAIENPDLLLKPQMFVTIGLIESSQGQVGYFIPSEAVVSVQGKQSVFIKRGDDDFLPVSVETGETKDNLIRIKSGLKGNELIVTQRAFQLMAQGAKGAIPSEEEESEKKTTSKSQPESILFLTLGGVILLLLGFLAGKGSKQLAKNHTVTAHTVALSKPAPTNSEGE